QRTPSAARFRRKGPSRMDIDIQHEQHFDTSPLSSLAITAAEQLEEAFDGDARLRTVMLVVEVETDSEFRILVMADDDREWVREKFLDEALCTVEAARIAAA